MPAALDFLASSDEEEAPRRGAKQAKQQSAKALKKPSVPRASRSRAASDSSDDSPDISYALLASSSSSSKGKAAAAASASASAFAGSEDEDDGLFIAAATTKHNKRAGTELARDVAKSQGKGKNKTGGGTVAGGGSFQSMGLPPQLLRSLLLRGYTTPTPIQRLAVPSLMSTPQRDLVGMARTGSGKTLAYMLPLLARLGGRHSTTVGVKSLIMCPSRELALQILRVGKELARGWKVPDAEPLRWALVVGGEGLEEQFALLAANPDVLIATPGRLLHLAVESNMDLSSVQYVVFDEADRLFEMGFAAQLEELLARLPPTRQTALFSATLPKSLVEFARAGLGPNPKLVRLDADSKISTELRMAFLSIKPAEKEAALLVLLRDVIGVPFGQQVAPEEPHFGTGANAPDKKRKRPALSGADQLLAHQTIIFCATKHHVEYLLALLDAAGYTCAHIYSSLHQAARTLEMRRFRDGEASLLIVTDVAARGLDMPSMSHVVNYDFPSSPRVFVHRVGRTARAGKSGWAWSLVTGSELPHLCDLQLFLARPLSPAGPAPGQMLDLHGALTLGTFPRASLDTESEHISAGLHTSSSAAAVALPALKQVVGRAQKLYERSSIRASQESHRRAKAMLRGEAGWALAGGASEESGVHDVVRRPTAYGLVPVVSKAAALLGVSSTSSGEAEGSSKSPANRPLDAETNAAREALLAKVNAFNPGETVFEVGSKGTANPLATLMKDRRRTLEGKQVRARAKEEAKPKSEVVKTAVAVALEDEGEVEVEEADEEAIQDVFDVPNASRKRLKRDPTLPASATAKKDYRDPDFYLDYTQKDAHTEKGYSLGNGGTFLEQAAHASFTLANDEHRLGTSSQAPNATRWDVKKKKFIKGDGVGADNERYIRTESGSRLPASFRSGRFDEWRKAQKVNVQKVGEVEDTKASGQMWEMAGRGRGGPGGNRGGRGGGGGRGFRHNSFTEPKRLDPLRKDYDKQVFKRNAKAEAGTGYASRPESSSSARGRGGFAARGARGGRGRGGSSRGGMGGRGGSHARDELKSSAQIQKSRQLASQRKEKNARPSKKRGGKR